MNHSWNSIFIFGAQYLCLIAVIIAFIWFLVQPSAKQKEILIIFCICLPLAYLVAKFAGHFYYNPRPFVLGHFQPLIPHKANNGFPSDHTLLVSIISAVVFLFSRRTSYLLCILTLFVGIARVYVGVHHIIDIVAGMAIPVAIVALVSWCKNKYVA